MTVQGREPAPPDAAGGADTRSASAGEERARLDAAVKGYDGFLSTFAVNPYTKHLARLAARLGLTPDALTLASLAAGVAAAACFALGSRTGLVAGAVLLVASFYLDGADGTLARYTQTFSSFGAWLDSVCDRAKEYLVYAGLAVGSVRGFDDDVWVLAASALALQTVRHLGDAAYVLVRREAETPLAAPADTPPERPRGGLLAAARDSSVPRWAHRIIRFPVGERLALIAAAAALTTPRTTLVALLVWGGIAAVYTVTGRVAYDHPATSTALRGLLR